VRDHGPVTSKAIVQNLGRGQDERTELLVDQVLSLLERFEEAGLVTRRTVTGPPAEPTNTMLPRSMMPDAVRRAIALSPRDNVIVTWEMTETLLHVQRALGVGLSELADQQERDFDPLVQELRETSQRLATRASEDALVRDQLLPCLAEIATCMASRCYAATLSLSGKALELVVKRQLLALGDKFDDNMMLGPLLGRIRDAAANRPDISAAMLDPSLGHIANLINQHRIAAVHAKRTVAPPTDDQARVVLHALLDVLRRAVLATL